MNTPDLNMSTTDATRQPALASFGRELQLLINKYSRENGSNTPDFILAEYIMGCLLAFDQAVESRDRWYGYGASPGGAATLHFK